MDADPGSSNGTQSSDWDWEWVTDDDKVSPNSLGDENNARSGLEENPGHDPTSESVTNHSSDWEETSDQESLWMNFVGLTVQGDTNNVRSGLEENPGHDHTSEPHSSDGEENSDQESLWMNSRGLTVQRPFKFRSVYSLVKEFGLPSLPAKALSRMRLVSKEWDQWITSPFLAYKQSYTFRDISGFFAQCGDYSPTFVALSPPTCGVPSPSLRFLPDIKFVIRSSCNGLLLCRGANEETHYICNPANKEWARLPWCQYYHSSESAVALAFEPSVRNMSANFSVIYAVTSLDHDYHIVNFDIFSSSKKEWRRSIADCVKHSDADIRSNGFYINGFAYWLTSFNEIIAFDLENELAEICSLPSESKPDGILAEKDGELCYICVYPRDQHSEPYVFEFYGGIEMTLKCKISVNVDVEEVESTQCKIVAFMNNDVLFFAIGDFLFSYQMSDQTVKEVNHMVLGSEMRFLPYVNSLVNLPQNLT